MSFLASIPSPSTAAIHLGPLRVTAYGLMIALGVTAAVELGRRRAPKRGGTADDLSALALWGVLAGLVGARVYHVITDLGRFRGNWIETLFVWNGGLGIPGGLIGGGLCGAWVAHRRGLRLANAMDIVAPAIPLAQSIGRWGNWWNQELFGRPTSLPWALRIDERFRPVGYERFTTFHPAFLYESLWNLALCGSLLLLDRRGRTKPGQLFWLFVAGYGLGRLWIESLRIDDAFLLGGIRVNLLMSLAAVVGGLGGYIVQGRKAPKQDTDDYVDRNGGEDSDLSSPTTAYDATGATTYPAR